MLGNTATKIIFRVSGEDAETLAKSIDIRYKERLISTLTKLPDGSAIVKLRAAFGQEPIPPFEIFTLPPLERKPVDFDGLLERMRERYAVPAPTPPALRIQPRPQIELSDQLVRFLRAVARVGDQGKGKLSRTLRTSPAKLNELIARDSE